MDISPQWKVQLRLPHPDWRVLKLLRYPILADKDTGEAQLMLRCSQDSGRVGYHYATIKGEFAEFVLPHEPSEQEKAQLEELEFGTSFLWAFTLAEKVIELEDEFRRRDAEAKAAGEKR